jgi:hypothetical protein
MLQRGEFVTASQQLYQEQEISFASRNQTFAFVKQIESIKSFDPIAGFHALTWRCLTFVQNVKQL